MSARLVVTRYVVTAFKFPNENALLVFLFSGEGFATMSQAFVDVGATLGAVKLEKENLIPGRDTVRASLLKIADKCRTNLREELSRQPSIGATTDHWTEEYSSKSYQSVTAHYITDDFQHKSRVLTMKEVKGSHTGKLISYELVKHGFFVVKSSE